MSECENFPEVRNKKRIVHFLEFFFNLWAQYSPFKGTKFNNEANILK